MYRINVVVRIIEQQVSALAFISRGLRLRPKKISEGIHHANPHIIGGHFQQES